MDVNARVFVAGHRGLVGSALMRRLESSGARHVLTATRDELDLRDQAAVNAWFGANRPDYVFLTAGTVGGIVANTMRPADFIHDNVMIAANVMHAAHRSGVRKLLFLGSSCAYPRAAPQPMNEDQLLGGPLEPTSEPYAIAKIAGIKLCEAYRKQHGSSFISAIPATMYGPNDNFDPVQSHVMSALIRRFHEAKLNSNPVVVIWGSGRPRREFLHVDDAADACVFMMEHYDGEHQLNIGTGEDLSIQSLAETLRDVIYPEAKLTFDASKPDGAPRKLLDVTRLHSLGWRHRMSFREGISSTYQWFLAHEARTRG
jgi:GDP-L-fucose synthase